VEEIAIEGEDATDANATVETDTKIGISEITNATVIETSNAEMIAITKNVMAVTEMEETKDDLQEIILLEQTVMDHDFSSTSVVWIN